MGQITQMVEETTKYMWRNKKNRLFMALMLVIMLLYVFIFAPDFNSHRDIDMEDLEYEMRGNAVQAQSAKENGFIVPAQMTGTTAYIEQKQAFGNQRELYTTIKQGDIYRYLETPTTITSEAPDTSLATMFYDLFGEEPLFLKTQRYIDEVPNLNFHIVHEITSLQQIHLFLIGVGPLILLSGLIFMISDVHTKDLNLPTQKSGLPLSWAKYLGVQALTGLGFVLGFYALFFIVFYLVNGLLHGFGSFSLPISFPQETIGWFLIRAVPYLISLFMLFTRLNTLLSLWTKQSVVTMAILIFIVFFSSLYMDAYTGETLSFNLGLLPTSYIDFGKIITGEHALTPIINGLSVYTSGLVVLGTSYVFTEIMLFISTKRITRQRFIAKGAH